MVPLLKKDDIYCTLGDHCTTVFEWNGLKFMRFFKEFLKLFKMRPTTVVFNKELKSYKQSKLNGSIAQKDDIYSTLGDHCTAVFERNGLKFMRFWKSFKSSFRWNQLQLYATKSEKVISNQSWIVPSLKKVNMYCTLVDHCTAVSE